MCARRASNPRAASRAYAIAHALEGMSRGEAARLAGMERQALRDAVLRYNAEGVSGLSDRPRIRPSRLTEGQQAALRALNPARPEPEPRRALSLDPRRHCRSDRGSVRPSLPRLQPEHDPACAGVLATKDAAVASERRSKGPRGLAKKKLLPAALAEAARVHPGTRITLFFQDEARFGQKGRYCRRLWLRGQRPTSPVDQRHDFAYVFAAVEPAKGRDACLILPVVSTEAMSLFLRPVAAMLTEDEHAVMVLDGASWHSSHDLAASANVTLLRLPLYAPELNPVERVWLRLRERRLSHRVLDGIHRHRRRPVPRLAPACARDRRILRRRGHDRRVARLGRVFDLTNVEMRTDPQLSGNQLAQQLLRCTTLRVGKLDAV